MSTPIGLGLLIYPLRGQGGVMLVIWTVALYGVLLLIEASRPYPTTLAVVGLMISIAAVISLGIFLLYVWSIFRHVAAGSLQQVRHIEVEDIHPFLNLLALKIAGVLLCIGGVVHLLFLWNPIAGWLATLTIGMLLPAVLGVVVLEERLLALLDGNVGWQFVRGLGVSYAGFAIAIYAGVMALYGACVAMQSPNIVAVFTASYVFVLGHVIAGRLLYSRRAQLSADVPLAAGIVPRTVTTQPSQRLEPLLVELHRLCRVDRVAEAVRKLEAFLSVDRYAGDEPTHQRLLQFHDRRLLLEHSWHYLNRLVATHKLPRAWLLLRDALAIDAMFRPATDTMVLQLIAVAPQGDALSVDALLADFERAYPDSELTDEALLARARVLAGQLGQHLEALAVLEQIATQFPARAATSDFVALHAQMQRFTDA